MNIVISDELEEKFRIEVSKIYGLRKGNISKAIIDAIEQWIKNNDKKIRKKK